MDKVCPKCGKRLVPICYGLPGQETFEAADRKEIYLGGCMPRKYYYHCYPCELSFSDDLTESMSTEL